MLTAALLFVFVDLLKQLCNEQKLGSAEWTSTLERGIKLCESLKRHEKADLAAGFDFQQVNEN